MASSTFTVTRLDSNQVTLQLNDLSEYPSDVLEPSVVTMTTRYAEYAQRIRDFQVYEDDVWIVTFPKSGTTWTEEMVWLINHDLDYQRARGVKLNVRSTFLEIHAIADRFAIDTIAIAENAPRPRQIKSHLPVSLLPRQLWTVKPKIVYVARNPKDVAISLYYHSRVFMGYDGTKESFLDSLCTDLFAYCPLVRHVLNFWALRHEPNVLFLTYERMKRNLKAVLPEVCGYFNKTFTKAELDNLAEHLSFSEMKKNPATNKHDVVRDALKADHREGEQFEFLRKGIVGDFKTELPEGYDAKLNQFITEQLEGSDFQYEYE
ncbi:luciferin sulfotransferase-like [Anopheles bellator]|uniref:luciferin sulfotransferase-like n=1 Tax=Anopheles bellator TaxID=139047 RepID=UPI002648AA5D|nr:luciferin sulfotransferase-like [Anopheles bellator]